MSNDLVKSILRSLKTHKNILLYGPPGTGKTHLLSKIVSELKQEASLAPTLNTSGSQSLFGSVSSGSSSQDIPISDVDWITFHQNYSYQDFIVGKRPKPEGAGMVLEPYLGKLMDNIINASSATPKRGTVLVIDEINRANVSKVFGEFITFLDSQYRETVDGNENPDALTINLAGIEYKNGMSEKIKSLKTGEYIEMPANWHFPENVYLIATMNSVDKAAMPLDAAMLRRFHQVEIKPDVSVLADRLEFDINELLKLLSEIDNGGQTKDALSPAHLAVLILDRVNIFIAKELGTDFEIGHSVFWNINNGNDVDEVWNNLIEAWDNKLLPLIRSRLVRAQGVLSAILNIENTSTSSLAFYYKSKLGLQEEFDINAPIVCKSLSSLSKDDAKKILYDLAF